MECSRPLYLTQSSSCACPNGSYWNGSSCEHCQKYCLECSDLNNCLQCIKNSVLIDSLCVCQDGFYGNGTSCVHCKNLCSSCSDDKICLTCKNNSEITPNKSCGCSSGYRNINNECFRNEFKAIIKVGYDNKITLLFTEPPVKYLDPQDFIMKISDKIINFTLNKITVSTYHIDLNFEATKSSLECLLIFKKIIKSSKNSILSPLNYSFLVNIKSDQIVIQEIEDMKSYAQSITNTGTAAVFGASALTADPSSLFSFLNTAEIFSYAVLFNNTFDPLLIAFLNALKTSSIIPNLFERFIKKDYGNKLEKKYQDFGMDTNLILLNTGVYYMFLIVVLAFVIIYITLGYVRNDFFYKMKEYLKTFLFFNAFLRLWIQSCLEITIAAILQIFEGEINGIYGFFDYSLSILTMVRDI